MPRIYYSAAVTIDAAPVTLIGGLSISREINAAALATFSIPLVDDNPDALKGKPVTIALGSGASPNPAAAQVYAGIVNDVSDDEQTATRTIQCTDNFQNIIKALDKAAIDAAIPGQDGSSLYDLPESNYDYALQRLNSTNGDIFLNSSGVLTYVAWLFGGLGSTYTEANIIEGSLRAISGNALGVTNKIVLKFDYRFLRGWHRLWHLVWDHAEWDNEIFNYGWNPTYPSKDMVRAALSDIPHDFIFFDDLPITQDYITSLPAGPFNPFKWVNRDKEKAWCLGFMTDVMQRWTQRVINRYEITVSSASSIALYGETKSDLQFSLDTDEQDIQFENDKEFLPPPPSETFINGVADDYIAILTSAKSTPEKFSAAIQCAIAESVKALLNAHRQPVCSFSIPMDTSITLGSAATVDSVIAGRTGQITSVEHVLSFSDGNYSALTNIELSGFIGGITGAPAIAEPTSPYADPLPTSVILPPMDTHIGYLSDPPQLDDETWTGYIGNRRDLRITFPDGQVYEENNAVFTPRVAIDIPDVPDADRNEVIYTSITALAIP